MAKRTDTLLAQCVLRAGQAFVDEEVSKGRNPDTPPTRRETMRAIWSATNVGSKVSALIVLWAVALIDLERDELHVTEFAKWSSESPATVYRRLQEFRGCWPEYELPNELAALVVAEVRRHGGKPSPVVVIPVAV